MPTTENSYTPREIRWSGCEDKFERKPVTVVAGQAAVLPEGSILGGPIASGDDAGKFGIYNPAATDGTEVAYGILAETSDAQDVDVDTTAYVAGIFRESALGAELDANAKLAMKARSHPDGSIILQGGG